MVANTYSPFPDLINPIDVDAVHEAYIKGSPVPWCKMDNFLSPAFADACCDSFPGFDFVQKEGKTFTNINERNKFQVSDINKFPAPLRQLGEVMNSPEFLKTMERITGIEKLLADPNFAGGGLHATGARGHLDVHIDFNMLPKEQVHRRLNILIYFNKGWKEEWGGEFELWDKEVQNMEHCFSPVFNRCVIFNTNEVSWHGVNAVKCPEGQSRKSFAGYYYTKEAPAHFDGTVHSTIFHARPDEKVKAVLMPLEKAGNAVTNFLHRGANKIKKATGMK
jgi:hypothetical protein